jgi:hypothetical protein
LLLEPVSAHAVLTPKVGFNGRQVAARWPLEGRLPGRQTVGGGGLPIVFRRRARAASRLGVTPSSVRAGLSLERTSTRTPITTSWVARPRAIAVVASEGRRRLAVGGGSV